MKNEGYIGYIKYEGALVKEGVMDARKQAQALLAIDHAFRHFITQQIPESHDFEFEIPVKIKDGSWVVVIASVIGLGLFRTYMAYCKRAGELMAENDFKNVGCLDAVKKAQDAIKWFAKLAKDMGTIDFKSLEISQHPDNNSLMIVCNADRKCIEIPKDILDMCIHFDPYMLEDLFKNIEDGRDLIIGSPLNGEVDEVVIDSNDKNIFLKPDIDKDIILHELVHETIVELEGEVTSENKTSNSMGFKYKEYILKAYPITKNIMHYKPSLFLKCRLYGIVSRIDKKGNFLVKPNLHFNRIESLEEDEGLFRK